MGELEEKSTVKKEKVLVLPTPRIKGETSVEEAIMIRRTVRKFSGKDVGLPVVSQLVWVLQGKVWVEDLSEEEKTFHRTAPSAGRSYPLEVYVAFSGGLYRYEAKAHALHLIRGKDVRKELSEAAITPLNREAIKTAPLIIILAMDNQRALKATPLMENAIRFVFLEAGHATQNLILEAASLKLGVCTITSYRVAKVYEALELPRDQRPIYLLPIGFAKE